MHPILMEALQMIKFSLKKKRLDFMEGWATMEYDMEGTVEDQPDLLAAFSNGEGTLDNIIAAVGRDDED